MAPPGAGRALGSKARGTSAACKARPIPAGNKRDRRELESLAFTDAQGTHCSAQQGPGARPCMQRRQGAEDHKFHLVSRLGTSPGGSTVPPKPTASSSLKLCRCDVVRPSVPRAHRATVRLPKNQPARRGAADPALRPCTPTLHSHPGPKASPPPICAPPPSQRLRRQLAAAV